MSRVVLFDGDYPELLLRDVERHSDGSVKRGWVINGAWPLERSDGRVYVAGLRNRSYWPDPGYTEFHVPADWRGDYNEIMNRARGAHAGA